MERWLNEGNGGVVVGVDEEEEGGKNGGEEEEVVERGESNMQGGWKGGKEEGIEGEGDGEGGGTILDGPFLLGGILEGDGLLLSHGRDDGDHQLVKGTSSRAGGRAKGGRARAREMGSRWSAF